jgi:predicted transcriptional regulator of viral defense system
MERHKVNREVLRSLARARVVTTRDLAELLKTSPEAAKKTALNLRKRGLLKAVKRGEYASVPLDVDPARFQPDPYLATRKAFRTGYTFSHGSALELLGGAQASRRTIHVSAPDVRARRMSLGGWVVHVHRAAADGWKDETMTVRRGGEGLAVTSPERTLVDLVSRPNSEQDYEETLEAFRYLLPRSNPSKFSALVLSSHKVSAKTRVGHLLLRSLERPSTPSDYTRLVSQLSREVASSGPSYFATRPKLPSNRFDQKFRIVYPGSG